MIHTLLLVLLSLALTACSQPAAESRSTAAEPPRQGDAATGPLPPLPQAAPPVPAQPPAEGWTVGILDVEKNVSGVTIQTSARTASHPDFDRFVLEFQGRELPSYHIEYIDRPVRQCGSGEVVDLAGDGWLQIRLEPANAHTEQGEPTVTQRATEPLLSIIRQTRIVCDFEAQVEWVLGVSSPNPYRVLELESPTRLVVDIRK